MKILLIFLFVFCTILPQVEPIQIKKRDCNEIEVKGEVVSPTFLCVKAESRIKDILPLLQLTPFADLVNVNQHIVLVHGDVINIQRKVEKKRISINFSSIEDLMTLSGIGESTAKKIIQYRNQFGLFQQIEDLMNVPGIKTSKFNKIQDDICL